MHDSTIDIFKGMDAGDSKWEAKNVSYKKYPCSYAETGVRLLHLLNGFLKIVNRSHLASDYIGVDF